MDPAAIRTLHLQYPDGPGRRVVLELRVLFGLFHMPTQKLNKKKQLEGVNNISEHGVSHIKILLQYIQYGA